MASTATAYDDMSPSPRVTLDIDPADLDPATDSVTILQLSKWGEVAVRDAKNRPLLGGVVVDDYELPPGIPVSYKVHQYDVSGASLGYALNLSAQVNLPRAHIVIQDPLAPANAVLIRPEFLFADALRKTRPTKIYQAGGRTFAMSGIVSALQQVTLRAFTETEEDRDTLAAILEQSTILVRTSPEMRLPGSFYATVSDIPMIPVDAREGGDWDLWDLVGNQVTRPELGIVTAVYSYDLFKAYLDTIHPPTAGTYDDAALVWSTYLDALRNPPAI